MVLSPSILLQKIFLLRAVHMMPFERLFLDDPIFGNCQNHQNKRLENHFYARRRTIVDVVLAPNFYLFAKSLSFPLAFHLHIYGEPFLRNTLYPLHYLLTWHIVTFIVLYTTASIHSVYIDAFNAKSREKIVMN